MLWIVLVILVGLVVFTGGGILGWILTGIQYVFSIIAMGVANLIGCFVKLIVGIIFLKIVYAFLFS